MARFSNKLRRVAQLFSLLVAVLSGVASAQVPLDEPALMSVPSPAPGSAQGAQQIVERFHAALMNGARTNGGFAVRASGVAAALDAAFDIERIARISAGRVWRDLDVAAKAEYVALLRDVVTGAYVSRFDADRGQSFETLSASEARPQQFVVRTRINRPAGKAVPLDYYLRGGRIFNVVADGVSDLSVRRADYAAIVKDSGFEGLMTHLRAQLAEAQSSSLDPQ